MARGDAQTRNTRKNKYKEKKKHPYRRGGGKRSMVFSESAKSEGSKKSKKSKKKKKK